MRRIQYVSSRDFCGLQACCLFLSWRKAIAHRAGIQ